MPLHLKIENEPSLPDGGPDQLHRHQQARGRYRATSILTGCCRTRRDCISGKHCRIRFKDGKYWLTDVSTNGTFVNRSEFRIGGPHALQHGDRIEIGRFIISVAIEPDPLEPGGFSAMGQAHAAPGQLWDTGEDAAPAINPRELRTSSVSTGMNPVRCASGGRHSGRKRTATGSICRLTACHPPPGLRTTLTGCSAPVTPRPARPPEPAIPVCRCAATTGASPTT